MKILIILDNYYIPQYTGGVESSTHELATKLLERGHKVSVLCKLAAEGTLALRLRLSRRLSGKPYACDNNLGYPTFRAWNVAGAVTSIVKEISPDVALVQNWSPVRINEELIKSRIPAVIYLHNVEMSLLDGDISLLHNVEYITNSDFTKRRYLEKLGIDSTAIPPLLRREQYCGRREPSNVTLINPHPKKGGYLAFDIAERLPQIPFHFFQSWTLGEEHYAFMRERMKTVTNVSFHTRTRDMKSVYSQAKIVLMPSEWEEAWGRAASEAHFSGIPVVASNIGGLPESVGPGGILIDPDSPIEAWVEAIRRLWIDDTFYAETSAAALIYSQRPEIDANRQVDTLLAVMQSAIDGARSTPTETS